MPSAIQAAGSCPGVRIDPLREASAHALLEALLGSNPELGLIKRKLIEATDRNPCSLRRACATT